MQGTVEHEINDIIRAGRSFEQQSDAAFEQGEPLRAYRLYRYAEYCFQRAEQLARGSIIAPLAPQ